MLAQDLPFRSDHEAIGVDPEADWSIGKGGGDAVAIALEADQAGRGHALALLDEAVEGRWQLHERRLLEVFEQFETVGPMVAVIGALRSIRTKFLLDTWVAFATASMI